MSDEIKIQTSAPDELAGGQQPLSADAEQKSRSGFVGSQVFRSFPPSPNVEGRPASLISPAANTREAASVNQMAVDSPVAPKVYPVDRRTIEGSYSYAGDTRAHAHDAVLPNQPGPREPKGQAQLNSKLRSLDGN
jgi:hypothetical protein